MSWRPTGSFVIGTIGSGAERDVLFEQDSDTGDHRAVLMSSTISTAGVTRKQAGLNLAAELERLARIIRIRIRNVE